MELIAWLGAAGDPSKLNRFLEIAALLEYEGFIILKFGFQ